MYVADIVQPSAGSDNSRPKFYALKTWDNDNDELYDNEVQVYRTLWQHDDIANNIARFYGSWRQDRTYNVLLEFVEGGTLTALLDKEHPISDQDLLQLWMNLVDILKPICRLHLRKHPDYPNQVISG
jgi:serine/threonine protein kinase